MSRKQIKDALIRLARAETAFLAKEFLAPVVRGRCVGVSIAGVRCNLLVVPADFQGWGVFRPLSHSVAVRVRNASAAERRNYLELFPQVRLIVCERAGGRAFTVAANMSDERFEISKPIPVQLGENVELFDGLLARFDGVRFWFDQSDPRSDPGASAHLRRSLLEMIEPEKLDRSGLTEGQRWAYAVAYGKRAVEIIADEHHRGELRLKAALAHGGASLGDFAETGDAYRVSFTLDGRRYTTVVRKHDFTVQTAGICLSGEDRKFDLSSLVGVLREGTAMSRF
jgi:hypothetical protein